MILFWTKFSSDSAGRKQEKLVGSVALSHSRYRVAAPIIILYDALTLSKLERHASRAFLKHPNDDAPGT